MELTPEEIKILEKLKDKFLKLNNLLNNSKFNVYSDLYEQYIYLNKFKKVLGNFNNDLSYIACLMAKQYLLKKHNFPHNLDMSLKKQGAKGLDIDEITFENERCIAEIKTIFPYQKNDFGTSQRKSFRKDFKKLKEKDAKYKYLFVVEEKSFNILKKKYISELAGIITVLLPSGQLF
ncbi:hypothetical protein LCGC14_1244620 [marine sediment metagenome]|uniref:Restriction endonuclease type IV Mrr domain-containing protein n=1 Tax=marine sediment metagenome TaxID=412755 RepID=A0A0F9L4V2_9ZZZZ